MEKYGGAREVADDNMANARCILDNMATLAQAHIRARALTHTHTQICNTYCFSTATMVS